MHEPNQIYELELNFSYARGLVHEHELHDWASTELMEIIDEVLLQYSHPQRQRRIEKIELDLGQIPLRFYQSEIKSRLHAQLSSELFWTPEQVREESVLLEQNQQQEIELSRFLQYGVLAWESQNKDKYSHLHLFQQVMKQEHGIDLIRDQIAQAKVVKRLVLQYETTHLFLILSKLIKDWPLLHAENLVNWVALELALISQHQRTEQAFWTWLLPLCLGRAMNLFELISLWAKAHFKSVDALVTEYQRDLQKLSSISNLVRVELEETLLYIEQFLSKNPVHEFNKSDLAKENLTTTNNHADSMSNFSANASSQNAYIVESTISDERRNYFLQKIQAQRQEQTEYSWTLDWPEFVLDHADLLRRHALVFLCNHFDSLTLRQQHESLALFLPDLKPHLNALHFILTEISYAYFLQSAAMLLQKDPRPQWHASDFLLHLYVHISEQASRFNSALKISQSSSLNSVKNEYRIVSQELSVYLQYSFPTTRLVQDNLIPDLVSTHVFRVSQNLIESESANIAETVIASPPQHLSQKLPQKTLQEVRQYLLSGVGLSEVWFEVKQHYSTYLIELHEHAWSVWLRQLSEIQLLECAQILQTQCMRVLEMLLSSIAQDHHARLYALAYPLLLSTPAQSLDVRQLQQKLPVLFVQIQQLKDYEALKSDLVENNQEDANVDKDINIDADNEVSKNDFINADVWQFGDHHASQNLENQVFHYLVNLSQVMSLLSWDKLLFAFPSFVLQAHAYAWPTWLRVLPHAHLNALIRLLQPTIFLNTQSDFHEFILQEASSNSRKSIGLNQIYLDPSSTERLRFHLLSSQPLTLSLESIYEDFPELVAYLAVHEVERQMRVDANFELSLQACFAEKNPHQFAHMFSHFFEAGANSKQAWNQEFIRLWKTLTQVEKELIFSELTTRQQAQLCTLIYPQAKESIEQLYQLSASHESAQWLVHELIRYLDLPSSAMTGISFLRIVLGQADYHEKLRALLLHSNSNMHAETAYMHLSLGVQLMASESALFEELQTEIRQHSDLSNLVLTQNSSWFEAWYRGEIDIKTSTISNQEAWACLRWWAQKYPENAVFFLQGLADHAVFDDASAWASNYTNPDDLEAQRCHFLKQILHKIFANEVLDLDAIADTLLSSDLMTVSDTDRNGRPRSVLGEGEWQAQINTIHGEQTEQEESSRLILDALNATASYSQLNSVQQETLQHLYQAELSAASLRSATYVLTSNLSTEKLREIIRKQITTHSESLSIYSTAQLYCMLLQCLQDSHFATYQEGIVLSVERVLSGVLEQRVAQSFLIALLSDVVQGKSLDLDRYAEDIRILETEQSSDVHGQREKSLDSNFQAQLQIQLQAQLQSHLQLSLKIQMPSALYQHLISHIQYALPMDEQFWRADLLAWSVYANYRNWNSEQKKSVQHQERASWASLQTTLQPYLDVERGTTLSAQLELYLHQYFRDPAWLRVYLAACLELSEMMPRDVLTSTFEKIERSDFALKSKQHSSYASSDLTSMPYASDVAVPFYKLNSQQWNQRIAKAILSADMLSIHAQWSEIMRDHPELMTQALRKYARKSELQSKLLQQWSPFQFHDVLHAFSAPIAQVFYQLLNEWPRLMRSLHLLFDQAIHASLVQTKMKKALLSYAIENLNHNLNSSFNLNEVLNLLMQCVFANPQDQVALDQLALAWHDELLGDARSELKTALQQQVHVKQTLNQFIEKLNSSENYVDDTASENKLIDCSIFFEEHPYENSVSDALFFSVLNYLHDFLQLENNTQDNTQDNTQNTTQNTTKQDDQIQVESVRVLPTLSHLDWHPNELISLLRLAFKHRDLSNQAEFWQSFSEQWNALLATSLAVPKQKNSPIPALIQLLETLLQNHDIAKWQERVEQFNATLLISPNSNTKKHTVQHLPYYEDHQCEQILFFLKRQTPLLMLERSLFLRQLHSALEYFPDRLKQQLLPVIQHESALLRLCEITPVSSLNPLLKRWAPHSQLQFERVLPTLNQFVKSHNYSALSFNDSLLWRAVFKLVFVKTINGNNDASRKAKPSLQQHDFARALLSELNTYSPYVGVIELLPLLTQEAWGKLALLEDRADQISSEKDALHSNLRNNLITHSATESNPTQYSNQYPTQFPMSEALPLDLSAAIFVQNGGIVLLAPYLQRLFSMLNLLDGARFISPQHADRAVHLLQYIVNAEQSTPEYQLPLLKLLCGIQGGAPISRGIQVQDHEQQTIESMLQAVISHWSALGNTSIAGLRETFLQREARLHYQEDAWHIKVNSKTFDVLMDRIPWSFATIKFPWMAELLYVEWRPNF
jgi:hypothetical protein